MNYVKTFRVVASLVVLGWAATARADINGSLWLNDFSNNASACTVCVNPPDITFTTTDINYDSRVTGYTISDFLTNTTFLTGLDPTLLSLDNTHIRFTGATYLNAGVNSFVVPHDDGLVLSMDGGIGIVLNQPGPTSPTPSPFDVTAPSAGLYNFTLDYNECCGPPGVLAFQVNGAPVGVPDGGMTLMLLGGALVGLETLRRKFRV
jgi:hypothetical protein